MITSVEILDRLEKECHLTYVAMADAFGITKSAVNEYRHGRRSLSDQSAKAAAELLNENPAYFIVCMSAERSRGTEIYPVWRIIAETMRKTPTHKRFLKKRKKMVAL